MCAAAADHAHQGTISNTTTLPEHGTVQPQQVATPKAKLMVIQCGRLRKVTRGWRAHHSDIMHH
eukprot:8839860-Pyramimonas_sp.AAC.1